MHWFTWRALTLVVFETLLIFAAVVAASYVRLGDWAWVVMREENGLSKTFLVAGVTQVCLYYGNLYDFRRLRDLR